MSVLTTQSSKSKGISSYLGHPGCKYQESHHVCGEGNWCEWDLGSNTEEITSGGRNRLSKGR